MKRENGEFEELGTVWKREEEKEERIKVRKKMIHKRLLSHLIVFLSYTEMENDIRSIEKFIMNMERTYALFLFDKLPFISLY